MKMLLTISLLASDRAASLERCLDSLKPLILQLPSELIIVYTGKNKQVLDVAELTPIRSFLLNGATIFRQHVMQDYRRQAVNGFSILMMTSGLKTSRRSSISFCTDNTVTSALPVIL